MSALGVSLPRILLGKKSNNETAWRTLQNVGLRTPTKKTLKLLNTLAQRIAEDNGIPPLDLAKVVTLGEGEQRYPTWEENVALWESEVGFLPFAGQEAILLEKDTIEIARHLYSGEIGAAIREIEFGRFGSLATVKSVVEHLSPAMNGDEFKAAAQPLYSVSYLYLVACAETDLVIPPFAVAFLPKLEGEKVIRPMRRWMTSAKAALKAKTQRELYDKLLVPISRDEDIETLRTEAGRWWRNGKLPSDYYVNRIIRSLDLAFEGKSHKEIVTLGISFVRIFDHFLNIAQGVQEKHLTWFDPIKLFSDYQLLAAEAQERRRK